MRRGQRWPQFSFLSSRTRTRTARRRSARMRPWGARRDRCAMVTWSSSISQTSRSHLLFLDPDNTIHTFDTEKVSPMNKASAGMWPTQLCIICRILTWKHRRRTSGESLPRTYFILPLVSAAILKFGSPDAPFLLGSDTMHFSLMLLLYTGKC